MAASIAENESVRVAETAIRPAAHSTLRPTNNISLRIGELVHPWLAACRNPLALTAADGYQPALGQ